MPSSYSASGRFTLQAPGENLNAWGTILNNGAFALIDTAIMGWLTKALTADYTLTTANGSADEARNAMMKFTGTGPWTVTIPSVSKSYKVWNAMSGVLTITTGAGATVTVTAGEKVSIGCDGSNVYRFQPTDFGGSQITSVADPTTPQGVATKAYADALAFASFAGTFPAQATNAGKFTQTDGSAVSWQWAVTTGAGLASVTTNTLTVTAASANQVRAGTSATTATTPAALTGSAAFITLTDAATVAWDASTGYNATVTLGGNRVIGAPTNLQDGITYSLELVQDATGSRVPTWASVWDFGAAGTPVLQTTAAKADKVYAQYNSRTSKLDASFRKGA